MVKAMSELKIAIIFVGVVLLLSAIGFALSYFIINDGVYHSALRSAIVIAAALHFIIWIEVSDPGRQQMIRSLVAEQWGNREYYAYGYKEFVFRITINCAEHPTQRLTIAVFRDGGCNIEEACALCGEKVLIRDNYNAAMGAAKEELRGGLQKKAKVNRILVFLVLAIDGVCMNLFSTEKMQVTLIACAIIRAPFYLMTLKTMLFMKE